MIIRIYDMRKNTDFKWKEKYKEKRKSIKT